MRSSSLTSYNISYQNQPVNVMETANIYLLQIQNVYASTS